MPSVRLGEIRGGEKERRLPKRMFFTLKNRSLNRKRSRVAFPEHLVPLKSPVHPSGRSSQPPGKLLFIHQSPTQMPPTHGCIFQPRYQLFFLLYSNSSFKPISLVTSTFSTSFPYVFPSLDCEFLEEGVYTSLMPVEHASMF